MMQNKKVIQYKQKEINEAFWFVITKEHTESQSNAQSKWLKRFELQIQTKCVSTLSMHKLLRLKKKKENSAIDSHWTDWLIG